MKILFVCIATSSILFCRAQQMIVDTPVKVQLSSNKDTSRNGGTKAMLKAVIIPLGLITYGFIAQGSNELKQLDNSTKATITTNHPGYKTTVDNYLQFAPAISVYALNVCGVKGKNNVRDRTMLYALSTIISTGFVKPLKYSIKSTRPDGSGNNSFPSGHTTIAFASAEFLRQEYKHVSPWYGIAGYAVAATAGSLRVYNNKHWVSDVVAGAGFGILSTKLAYWIYPTIKKKLFRNKSMNALMMPYHQNGTTGVAFVYNFRK